MEVFRFEKSLADRLEEAVDVLSYKETISPTQIHVEWASYIELQVESTGWRALWRIPRVICEELHVRFPTVVSGMVEQVFFKELKANFNILAVQDDNIHLPECYKVNLEDLWPTKEQENDLLHVERLADCIDRLRFFYKNVWMPWDDDNDMCINWVEKYLETRIRLLYDLKKNMKSSTAFHILNLLAEATYIKERRGLLESNLCDDNEFNILNKMEVDKLMRLHLRLTMIKNEVEILQCSELRNICEEMKFGEIKCVDCSVINDKYKSQTEDCHSIVTHVVLFAETIENQIEYMKIVQKTIANNELVQICPSLQNTLNICNTGDHISLCPGKHAIKFSHHLGNNGSITGLNGTSEVTLMARNDDNVFMYFYGNYTISNVTIDCRNVQTGIIMKNSTVTLQNCRLIGDGKSSTMSGIMCLANSHLIVKDSVIEHFSTGIIVKACDTITLENTNFVSCKIAMDMEKDYNRLNLINVKIVNSSTCGINMVNNDLLNNTTEKCLRLTSLSELRQHTTVHNNWSGECTFHDCTTNIMINEENLPSKNLDFMSHQNENTN